MNLDGSSEWMTRFDGNCSMRRVIASVEKLTTLPYVMPSLARFGGKRDSCGTLNRQASSSIWGLFRRMVGAMVGACDIG